MVLEPFVKGYVESEELLFGVERVNHLNVELGVAEGGIVKLADIIEKIPGDGGVRIDRGGGEAEVSVILRDLLVDGGVMDGDGRKGDLSAQGGTSGEEAAVDVLEGGGRQGVMVSGDELDTDIVKGESVVGIIGDDDADGDKAVLDVGKAEKVACLGFGAGVGGYADVLVGMGIEGNVLGGGAGGGSLSIGSVGDEAREGSSEGRDSDSGAGSARHADEETLQERFG